MAVVRFVRLEDGACIPCRRGDGTYLLRCCRPEFLRRGRNVLRLGFRLDTPEWVCAYVQSVPSCRVEGLDGCVHRLVVRPGFVFGKGEMEVECRADSAFRLGAGDVVGVMRLVSCPPLDMVEDGI